MMDPDILIVRESDGFRLLHGQLHLANVLSRFTEVTVSVSGEGEAQVIKGANGFLVDKDGQRQALHTELSSSFPQKPPNLQSEECINPCGEKIPCWLLRDAR